MEAAGVKGYYATIGGDGLVPTEFESGRQDASMGDECVSKAIDKDIDCIVVGWDSSINARKVGVAVNIIAWHEQMYPGKPRLQIIACSVDASGVLGTTFYGVPKTEYKVKAVGNGAMASFIAHCFDPPLSWVDLGKPSDALIEMLSSPAYKIDLKKSLMVGDTLQTDIVFGTRGGMSTLLVLTGVADRKAADAAVGDEVPVFISERLGNYEDTQPLLEFDACKKIGKLMRRELVTREQLNQNHTSAEYNSFACTVGRVAESRGLDQVSTDYEPPPPVLRSSTSPSVVETVSPLHHPLTRNDSLGPGRSKRATIALPDEVLPVRSSTSVPSAEGSPKRQLHRWNTSSRRMSMGLAELRPDAPKQYIKLAAGLTSKMAQHVQKTAAVIRPLSRATSAPAGVCVFDTETRSKLRRKRAELLRLRQALTGIKNEVAEAQNQSHTSTRTGFLEPLVKKIGNPPARPWENEWKALNVEFFRLNGELSKANEECVPLRRRASPPTAAPLRPPPRLSPPRPLAASAATLLRLPPAHSRRCMPPAWLPLHGHSPPRLLHSSHSARARHPPPCATVTSIPTSSYRTGGTRAGSASRIWWIVAGLRSTRTRTCALSPQPPRRSLAPSNSRPSARRLLDAGCLSFLPFSAGASRDEAPASICSYLLLFDPNCSYVLLIAPNCS